MFQKFKNLITDKEETKETPQTTQEPPKQSQQSTKQSESKPSTTPVSRKPAETPTKTENQKDTLQNPSSQQQAVPQSTRPVIPAIQRPRPQRNFQQDIMEMRAAEVEFESDDDEDAFFTRGANQRPKATLQYQSSQAVQYVEPTSLAQSQRHMGLNEPSKVEEPVKPPKVEPEKSSQVEPIKPQQEPVKPPLQTLVQPPVKPPTLQPVMPPTLPQVQTQQVKQPPQQPAAQTTPVQKDNISLPGSRRPNRRSRQLDLDLDDEEGDDVNPLGDHFDLKRGKQEGASAALERIRQKRERGTVLPSKSRPSMVQSDQDSAQKQTEDMHNHSPPKVISENKIEKQPVNVKVSLPDPIVDKDDEDHFQELSQKRMEVTRMASERRSAVRKNVTGPLRMQQQKQEAVLSSDSDLTDKKFEDSISIDSDEIEETLQRQFSSQFHNDESNNHVQLLSEPKEPKQTAEGARLIQLESDESDEDILGVITQNENMFKHYGEKKLKDQRNLSMQSSKSLQKFKESSTSQSVLKEPKLLKYMKVAQQQETCIAAHGNIILIGTKSGQLFAFNSQTEAQIGIHKQDSKDFANNAVTAIDIHHRRADYCVIGYERGQLVLISLAAITKTIKLIKDHHTKPIVSVKFCDWSKEKPHLHKGATHKCKECEDVKSWMFISVDQSGKLVQNTVDSMGFGMMYANDNVLVDPAKDLDSPLYQVLAPRMTSVQRPLDYELDFSTLVALGSAENVAVWITPEKSKLERFTVSKPERYPSQNMDDVIPVMSQLPILAWGFGRTPRFNYQVLPLLAIAWGPIIQLVVFRDINKDTVEQNFESDGYYIIAPEKTTGTRSQNCLDTTIRSLHFIDESLLLAVTSNNELRVMLTHKFKENQFIPPAYLENVDFTTLDSRCKMMPVGQQLTTEQEAVEMERLHCLQHALVQSSPESAPAQSVTDDQIVWLTQGGVYVSRHLNWLESLGDTAESVSSGAWIEIFAKALEIYTGKVKGLRLSAEDERRDSMRDQLKVMIDHQVQQIISQWKQRAETNVVSGTMSLIQVQEDLNSKFQTLIRIVIEFCVEIQEPEFLFDQLLKKFTMEQKSTLFADELKPYILSGHFAECTISESILHDLLSHHQKVYTNNHEQIKNGSQGETLTAAVSPAESFEKIVVNFRFDTCSLEFKQNLQEYCRKYGLTSALMYMCLCCYGEQGPLQALTQLKDFYQDTLVNEAMGDSVLQREDLNALQTMPANYFDRILLERSSCYLGLKLLWLARLFIQGKKYPRGFFTTQEWQVCCHDLIELMTQDDLIQLLTEINAEAYFQILSAVFIQDSPQFKFLKQGRPAPQNTFQTDSISITHDLVVKRLSNYFNQAITDPSHIDYLCFMASIAGTYKQEVKDERIYYDVALELINNNELFLQATKQMLDRKGAKYAMCKRLQCISSTQYIALCEQMLLVLVERARSTLQQWRPERQKLLKASEDTGFLNVKLVLNELNDDYLKCLQLYLNSQSDEEPMRAVVTWQGTKDGFSWIKEKFLQLEKLSSDTKGQVVKQQLANFKTEVLSRAPYFVKQDVTETIKFYDQVVRSAHTDVLDNLNHDQSLQLKYIQTLLQLKKDDIREALIASGAKGVNQTLTLQKRTSTEETKNWHKLLTLHIRLLCELSPSQVTNEVEKVIKDGIYPMEDCLKICTEFNQTEAAALLNKKIGNYYQAIQLYLQILKREMNYERLKKELYYLNQETKRHVEKERQQLFSQNQARFKQQASATALGDLSQLLVKATVKAVTQLQVKDHRRSDLYRVWVEKFGKNIYLLDRSLEKIMNICKAHPKEVLLQNEELWQTILTFLFTVLFHPSLRKKSYCKRHFKLKIVEFCRCILAHVSFSKIIYGASAQTSTLRFKAVKELVNDVFADKSQEFEMCENAQTTQRRDLLTLQSSVLEMTQQGVCFTEESLICAVCSQMINQSLLMGTGPEGYKIFDCKKNGSCLHNHAYHNRCLKKYHTQDQSNRKAVQGHDLERHYRCPQCYPKSQDVIIQQPTEVAKSAKRPQEDSGSDQENNHSQETVDTEPVRRYVAVGGLKTMLQYEKQMRNFDYYMQNEFTLSKADFIL